MVDDSMEQNQPEPGFQQPEEMKVEKTDSIIKISGTGKMTRVDAKELYVSGSGRVTGPVNVLSMEVSGSAKINGPIKCDDTLKVSGSLKALNDVAADMIFSSGFISMRNCECDLLSVSGVAQVDGSISAEKIEESGTLRAKSIKCSEMKFNGIVKADTFDGKTIEIHGSLDSDQVKSEKFDLEAVALGSKIGKLEADTVKITVRKRLIFPGPPVSIDTITGKDVVVEGVKCRRIVAEKVIIRDRCSINYVEAEEISISGKSAIEEQRLVQASGGE